MIPNYFELFSNATSLGGCESLVEYRYLNDKNIDSTLCRFSIGLEDYEDLKNDFEIAFNKLKLSLL